MAAESLDHEPDVSGPTFDTEGVTVAPPRLELRCSTTRCAWSLVVTATSERPARATFVAAGATLKLDGSRSSTLVETVPGDGRPHELVVTGVVSAVRHRAASNRTLASEIFGLAVTGLEGRHLLFGEGESADAITVEALVPTAMTGEVRARIPDDWYFEAGQEAEAQQEKDERGRWVSATTSRPHSPLRLVGTTISPLRPHGFFFHGGPVLGLGSEIGHGFRARGAYDIGLGGRTVLGTLAVDTDFEREVVATPLVKVASPWLVFSPGFGVGVPVRAAPFRETGLRVEADLVGPVLGVVASADVWLATPDHPRVTWTVLSTFNF